jgi:hypothetical protein
VTALPTEAAIDTKEEPPTTDEENHYPSGGTVPDRGTNPPGVYGPKTGDTMNSDFYIILLAVSGIAAIGAAIYMIYSAKVKRRDKRI